MLIKSLFWQIINSIIKICLEIFVFDRKIRRILKGNWAKFYLRKYVVKGCKDFNKTLSLPSLSPQETSLPLNGCCGREQSFNKSLCLSQGEGMTEVVRLGDSRLVIARSSSEDGRRSNPQNDMDCHEEQSSSRNDSTPKVDIPNSQIIWQYWESKDGSIPPLVQACLNSVDKFKGNRTRIILTYDKLKDYIDLPQKIYELKENGKMNLAHFVDIVRTALLIQYGGIWIDSTVLLTEELPDFVESDLFFFQNDEKVDLDGLCGTNYFIVAKPDNKILKQTLASMLAYWKENRFLVNYFTHMHIITMVARRNKDEWAKIPFFSFYPVQRLQTELLNQFDEKRWTQLKKTTPIHKLTHKRKVLSKKKEIKIEGTFFEHILEEFK